MAKKELILKVVLNKKIASLVESYILIGIYMKILYFILQRYKKKLRFQSFLKGFFQKPHQSKVCGVSFFTFHFFNVSN